MSSIGILVWTRSTIIHLALTSISSLRVYIIYNCTIHVSLLRRGWWWLLGWVALISVWILRRVRITSIGIATVRVSSVRITAILISIGIAISLISVGIGRWGWWRLLWSTLWLSYGLSINLKALKS